MILLFCFAIALFLVCPVAATAGAQVTSLWPISDTPSSKSIDFWAEVKNTGDVPLDVGCFVKFYVRGPGYDGYLPSSRSCVENDYPQGGEQRGSLLPGKKRWYKVSWIPVRAGSYSYWAIVEYGGRELSRWSSEQKFKVTEPKTSAQVTSLWPVKNAQTGKSVELWAEVKNTGDIYLGSSCAVRFYVQGPGIDAYIGQRACTENDYPKSNPNSGNMAPNEKRWYKVYFIPQNSGSYKYWAIVQNSGKDISRWSSEMSFTVSAPFYSAKVTRTWPVYNGEVGKSQVLWAEVQNTGNTALGSGCMVRFWVRGGGTDGYIPAARPCTANDDLKSNSKTGDVSPGEKRWYKVSWLPTSAGSYRYWAIVENNGVEISKWSAERFFRIYSVELEIERIIHDKVNIKREQNGKGRLSLDPELSAIARAHSRDMLSSGFFNHVSPTFGNLDARYRRAGYQCKIYTSSNSYTKGGENIAYYKGYSLEQVANRVADDWMNSKKGHRENMLRSYWGREGIGVAAAYINNVLHVYVTQDFC